MSQPKSCAGNKDDAVEVTLTDPAAFSLVAPLGGWGRSNPQSLEEPKSLVEMSVTLSVSGQAEVRSDPFTLPGGDVVFIMDASLVVGFCTCGAGIFCFTDAASCFLLGIDGGGISCAGFDPQLVPNALVFRAPVLVEAEGGAGSDPQLVSKALDVLTPEVGGELAWSGFDPQLVSNALVFRAPVLVEAGGGAGSDPQLVSNALDVLVLRTPEVGGELACSGFDPQLVSNALNVLVFRAPVLVEAGSGAGSDPQLVSNALEVLVLKTPEVGDELACSGFVPQLVSNVLVFRAPVLVEAEGGAGSDPQLVSNALDVLVLRTPEVGGELACSGFAPQLVSNALNVLVFRVPALVEAGSGAGSDPQLVSNTLDVSVFRAPVSEGGIGCAGSDPQLASDVLVLRALVLVGVGGGVAGCAGSDPQLVSNTLDVLVLRTLEVGGEVGCSGSDPQLVSNVMTLAAEDVGSDMGCLDCALDVETSLVPEVEMDCSGLVSQLVSNVSDALITPVGVGVSGSPSHAMPNAEVTCDEVGLEGKSKLASNSKPPMAEDWSKSCILDESRGGSPSFVSDDSQPSKLVKNAPESAVWLVLASAGKGEAPMSVAPPWLNGVKLLGGEPKEA